MNDDRFYIQDQRHYIGNSIVWWAKGGKGYTGNIDNAQVFTRKKAEKLVSEAPQKYTAWNCEHIDTCISRHVDIQHVDRNHSIDANW